MAAVVFVAPFFLEATLRFVDAAADLPGVRLGLVSQDPVEKLPPRLRGKLAAHYVVADGMDPQQIADAVRGLAPRLGGVDALVAALEQLQVPLAEVREALGIAGMNVETAHNFRDKSRMKTVLRAAGVPCARHQLVGSAETARQFVHEVGYPVVAKPPAGAGAVSTFRLDSDHALREWLAVQPLSPHAPTLLEEFMTGDEHSFDSVCVDGDVVWHSVSRYYPTPLEVVRNPWMQWVVLLPRDISVPAYDEIRRVGPAALSALGLGTGLTHMEWFRRPDGSVAVSEVAARPPGAQITSLLSYAHDIDFYRAWAALMVFNRFDPPSRRYAVGAAYLRGQGQGRVRTIHGLAELQRELGHLVVEARLP
ncbi:MAG: acetyl-CoA carboxylase biotin carboxylase subunit family protein, partial [Mycobacteriales bacterium]